MTRNVLFLARADLTHALRAKETLLWTFLMPLLFFFFLTKMDLGPGGGGGGPEHLQLAEGARGGVLTDQLVGRLEEQGYTVERVAPDAPAPAPGERAPERVLEVPADLTERALMGEASVLRLRREPVAFSSDYDDFRVGRAVYTVLADLASLEVAGEPVEEAAFASLAEMPRALTLDVRPAGKRKEIPSGREQSIPGILVMFTLVLLLTSGCVPMVNERRDGLFRRLASAPIARWEILGGRWLSIFSLGLVQIGYAMVAGSLLFDMDWGPNLWAVVLILIPWASLAASLALLSGCLARTEGQAVGIGVLAANVLAALGGCWWPIEITPDWMQDLSKLLPTGWIMDALHKLISFQDAPASVLPHALVMLTATLVVGWLGVRRFRYE